MDFQTMNDDTFQHDYEKAVVACIKKCDKELTFNDWVISYGLYSVGKNNGFNEYPYFAMLANSLLNAQVTSNIMGDTKVVEDNKRTIKFDLVQTQNQTDGRGR